MQAAPAVTHRTGRTPRLAALLLGLWALGVLAAVAALALQGAPLSFWGVGALLAAPLATGAALGGWWRSQRPRVLAWDGVQWSLNETNGGHGAPLDRLQVRLDLQSALLLHARHAGLGRGIWLWAQAGADAARWHLLRCAVHARVPAPGDAAAGEGARV